MDYLKRYQEWLESDEIDEETKEELRKIKNDETEIKDSFYKDLEFGTAGLRGIVGVGTNRMNKYTVGKATQGLANYIVKNNGQDKGVAIAYDSRNMSQEFSKLAALILNANGIKTYRFESLRPTPELSYTVRELGCISGIVITASHNPPKYNGYKVYWEDGAQISAPVDAGITEEVNAIKNYSDIKEITEEEATEKGLYNTIGEEIDNKYIEYLKSIALNKEIDKEYGKDIKIVYTPLHGTGKKLALRILNELGFTNVHIVKEQAEPDGRFPTVSYPNPEDPAAFELALKLAKEIEKQASKKNVCVDILVEVNIAEEESKFGIHKEETYELVRQISELPHVHIRGLMTIAPYVEDAEDNRMYFRGIHQLSVDIANQNIDNVDMDILSMGMTGDYMVAIEEGATMVRVGTGIFGARNYNI